MRLTAARISAAGRFHYDLIGMAIVAGFVVVVPAVAHADPAGCARTPNGSGDDIVCRRQ